MTEPTADPKAITALVPHPLRTDDEGGPVMIHLSLRFIVPDQATAPVLQINYDGEGWEEAMLPPAMADVVAARPAMVQCLHGETLPHYVIVEATDRMGAEVNVHVEPERAPLLGTTVALLLIAGRGERMGDDDG